MTNHKVNNGHRVPMAFGEFVGEAGFVQRTPDTAQLAFIPNARGPAAEAGAVFEINERLWRVVLRERSDFVDGMVVLTLSAKPAATIVQGQRV